MQDERPEKARAGDDRRANTGTGDPEALRIEAMTFGGVGTYRYSMDGKILHMDAPTLAYLDLTRDYPDPSMVVGKNLSDVIVYEKPVGTLRRRVLEHGVARDFEYAFRTLGGKPRVVLHNSYLVTDPGTGEPAIQVVFRDITERKRAEAELERMHRLESLGTIAGGIAHDFNNMLMVVFGNIELAMTNVPETSEVAKCLSNALSALRDARNLTGQILTFSRGGSPNREAVDTRELVEESVRFNIHGKPVSAIFDLPADLWDLHADKGQISQVIANLTLNAVQAMPGGGKFRVEGRNEETAAPDPGPCVRLVFADDGTGISPEVIDRVFDPYFSTKGGGRGLGLAIVHSIVVRHGGRIRVRSKPGEGTVFTIHLPALPNGDPKAPRREVGVEQDEPGSPLRILVMDDDPGVRSLICQMLERSGHVCETAREGGAALDRYSAASREGRPFDLVILDLNVMGGKGGRETMAALLELDPEVRAIVSSGYADDSVMADFAACGFRCRIAKPFVRSELERAISEAMRGRRGPLSPPR